MNRLKARLAIATLALALTGCGGPDFTEAPSSGRLAEAEKRLSEDLDVRSEALSADVLSLLVPSEPPVRILERDVPPLDYVPTLGDDGLITQNERGLFYSRVYCRSFMAISTELSTAREALARSGLCRGEALTLERVASPRGATPGG